MWRVVLTAPNIKYARSYLMIDQQKYRLLKSYGGQTRFDAEVITTGQKVDLKIVTEERDARGLQYDEWIDIGCSNVVRSMMEYHEAKKA